ncbi:hypothetical protein PSPO01_13803 [Paraphaeosphaeria sporulosa]
MRQTPEAGNRERPQAWTGSPASVTVGDLLRADVGAWDPRKTGRNGKGPVDSRHPRARARHKRRADGPRATCGKSQSAQAFTEHVRWAPPVLEASAWPTGSVTAFWARPARHRRQRPVRRRAAEPSHSSVRRGSVLDLTQGASNTAAPSTVNCQSPDVQRRSSAPTPALLPTLDARSAQPGGNTKPARNSLQRGRRRRRRARVDLIHKAAGEGGGQGKATRDGQEPRGRADVRRPQAAS